MVAALLLFPSIHVSGQTLYFVEVSGDATPAISTLSISAEGVGPDGATTYVEIGVNPTFVRTIASQTITVLSVPTPFTTCARGCSNLHDNRFALQTHWWRTRRGSGKATLSAMTCSFASDGSAACVKVIQVQDASTREAHTFSASVVPFYTLGVTPPSSTPTSPSRGVSLKARHLRKPGIARLLVHVSTGALELNPRDKLEVPDSRLRVGKDSVPNSKFILLGARRYTYDLKLWSVFLVFVNCGFLVEAQRRSFQRQR
ncbi:hypothetical protein DFH09DRAFT_1101531 [Mycena vulgaris]|nr:hypothetical protein DFH09DRAFT_1101531 [Mycena vulgaris]